MDPELQRIRRERYLAHRRNEGNVAGGGLETNGAVKRDEDEGGKVGAVKREEKREGNDGAEVIVIDSDNEEEERKPSSKTVPAAVHNDDSDDEVECLSGPPPKKKRARSAPSEGVCYLDERAGTLHDTHPRVKDEGGWLWARNPLHERESRNDVESMTREFNGIVARGSGVTRDEVLELGARHEVLYGKWMIWNKQTPALLWTKIRDAVFSGQFGCTAKISNVPINNGCFLICIYTADFTDKREVIRLRQSIARVLENGKYSLPFKPDCYTYLEINGGNPYKLKPTIYLCGGKNDPECSVLRANGVKCTRKAGCPCCFPRCKS